MKKKILLLVSALTLFLAACTSTAAAGSAPKAPDAPRAQSPAPKDAHCPVTVANYNYAGEEITLTFEKAPERVLAVYQGCIETMIALGLEDRVAASYGLDNEVKDEWKDGFSRMKYNDSSFAPDKETAVMLRPDLIFSWGSLFGEKALGEVGYWIQKGTNTYMNTNTRRGGDRTLENEYADILNIGKIFGVEDRAEALVNRIKADVEKARAAVRAEPSAPSVAIIGFYDSGIRNYGSELAGNIAEHLGVKVMQSAERYMGKEDLLNANPDVIFIEYMPRPDKGGRAIRDEQLAKLLKDPSFASLNAVKNGKVCGIMLGDIYAPAVRAGDGIRTIANGLFPGILN